MLASHWDLIERTRPDPPDAAAHAAALADALAALDAREIIEFQAAFDAASGELVTWDLWGAAYMALGGCSDDAFTDLRAWVIAQGRARWEQARDDPEGLFVSLLQAAEDPEQLAAEAASGESVLHAAATAHERVTGGPLPTRSADPGAPAGDPWDDHELPARFPRLANLLPGESWDDLADEPGSGGTERGAVHRSVLEGVEAFTRGDHDRAYALLEPILEDAERFALVDGDPADVAYVAGIVRLQRGDPDGAAAALRRVASQRPVREDVRRALAQVELARGELSSAENLLIGGWRAGLHDRALRVVLAHRQGDHRGVARQAARVLHHRLRRDDHPWDVAGCLALVGMALVEVGDARGAAEAAGRVHDLIDGAPPELPLWVHQALVAAGALRLAGHLDAAEGVLDGVEHRLGEATSERGLTERERARLARARGDTGTAADRYDAALRAFAAAGERWDEQATRTEAGSP